LIRAVPGKERLISECFPPCLQGIGREILGEGGGVDALGADECR
jgi:hypothetical protein